METAFVGRKINSFGTAVSPHDRLTAISLYFPAICDAYTDMASRSWKMENVLLTEGRLDSNLAG
jgi:hypothetical protein